MIGTQHINPKRELGVQLEHALARSAPVAVGGGWGGLGRAHAPARLIQYLQRTVLQGMVLVCNAERLVGLPQGSRRDVGVCRLDGWPLTFALWVPHFGIAIDLPGLSDAEVQHKRQWCESLGVLYIYVGPDAVNVSAHNIFDAGFFARMGEEVATRRRQTLQDAA